ncbi:M23 family metallopeptidase [Bacillus sp. AK128]
MNIAVIQLIIFQLVLPIVFIIPFFKGPMRSKLEWIIQSLFTLSYLSWIFFSSPWDWFSYYLRFLWPVLFVLGLYLSWKKVRNEPFKITYTRSQKWSIGIYVLLALIFGMYHFSIFGGYGTDEKAVELDFPLKNGTYYVGQGGGSIQVNYHYAYLPQQFALDIVKLNAFGARAAGVYPNALEEYTIFGDELYSPCMGQVIEVRNDAPDLIPPNADPERPEGNYVKLYCENEEVDVFIAHMQEGSVDVTVGDTLQKGQFIGLVGNSGNTSEPHLHIHAERNGEGVPIHFNGKFLVRNSIVR